MGLQLNVSNSLFRLVEQLANNLQKPLPTVFQPHFIVTQTLGMNNWLKIQIAEKLGITANCQFLKPNDIINHVYFLLDGPQEQILSVDNLQWLIYGLLDEYAFKGRFPFIAQYYNQGEDTKRMALAEKVADLFDQYQIYRPEMINEWNNTQTPDLSENNWQKYLWIAVKGKIGDKMPDKTRVGKFIIDSLQNPLQQEKLRRKLPQIDFFGISIITEYHLEVFHELAKHIDISFNLLNPSPSIYWFDDKSPQQIARWKSKARQKASLYEVPIEGNALLTNWGSVIQNTFGLFFKDDDFLNEYEDSGIEPAPKSLLSKIQNDIYNNAVSDDRSKFSLDDLKDGSISLNSCYTPVREVEALYNYLVHLVNQDPGSLSPRDMVVMVSDIDTYAPYIKAIFKSAPYSFPFTIADESIQSSDGLIGALHAILNLEESFKAEDILQILEWSYIRNRFNIEDIELIRRIVDEANIRFGIEGNISDDTVYVSWLNGLNRVVYGISMKIDEAYELNDYSFYPLDIVEGEQAFELIRFSHFVEVLVETIREQQKDRTLIEWGEYILRLVSNLIFQSEEEVNDDYQLLINYVKKLNLISENIQEKIGFHVFKYNFLSNLSGEIRTNNFASGGITFCSLIPMRSIPFKVVALLGLGFDKFPRKEDPLSFNIMQQEKRKGDRNIKENDKHLFLETILSAQEHLYISYIGKNTKDNTLLPPSAIVDELIDYIVSGIDVIATNAEDSFVREQFVIQHPLHNFTPQPSGISNYLAANDKRVEKASFENSQAKESSVLEEVSINELINFFKNPFEYYHNKVLNIYYREERVLLPETEHFELDGLQEWQIKQDFLFLGQQELDGYIQRGIKKGQLPLKNMSQTLLTNIYSAVESTKQLVEESINNQDERTISIELEVEGIKITGEINKVFGDRMILVSFSKHNNKYRLEAYIKYLLAIASNIEIDSYLISDVDKCIYKIDKSALSVEEAREKLGELVRAYFHGQEKPFMFHPRFENDPDKLAKYDLKKYERMLNGIFQNEHIPCGDQYLLNEYDLGFFEQEGMFEEYLSNSEMVISAAFRLFKIKV
ncbi:exodeoxyribonuclease V subunit gamma [Albibacterium bauzanense]|uniref:RecBCD enzyme subunit RecC n=1 Tax=Albibacterium bauzanense TaxID=653929 RepID=A0A4R1M1N9_9SPHI|nr:exodeoxyribonuclease V subunit gamma [Albibacterium bauzanense]TCK85112.1 DNA helicase/exodeoxyribonuclease V gamma subunit [Albibacterium bauzanense]